MLIEVILHIIDIAAGAVLRVLDFFVPGEWASVASRAMAGWYRNGVVVITHFTSYEVDVAIVYVMHFVIAALVVGFGLEIFRKVRAWFW